jgi:hypothetical protein
VISLKIAIGGVAIEHTSLIQQHLGLRYYYQS